MAGLSDIMLELGPIPAEPEADVQGVLRGAENGNGLGEQLRSLAHPEWPYAGTPNEWRGFAERVIDSYAVMVALPDISKVDLRPGGLTVVYPETKYQLLKFGRLD